MRGFADKERGGAVIREVLSDASEQQWRDVDVDSQSERSEKLASDRNTREREEKRAMLIAKRGGNASTKSR